MRLIFLLSLAITFSTGTLIGQSANNLSQDIAAGLAELRQDVFARQALYIKNINAIITSLDTSTMDAAEKKFLYDYMKYDMENGAKSNSTEVYNELPEDSPLKNTYMEQYVVTNQDFLIDKELTESLIKEDILTADKKINQPKLQELLQDLQFLDIQDNEKVLLHNAEEGLYAMLIGYTHENVELTIRHFSLFDRYLVLDRFDRYPNVNNGNLIEFLHEESVPLKVKNQQWDKIIIRQKRALESAPAYYLKSLHDNLAKDGHLYVLHRVKSDAPECDGGFDKATLIKRANRSDFELVDSQKIGCLTYFKFKSVKVLK